MNIIKLSESQIANQYKGFDLYYDRQDKILYSTPKALARWVGCDARTIKKVVGTLGVGKIATIPTRGGTQGGRILSEAEIEMLLRAISESKRTKDQTRSNAKDLYVLILKHGLKEALPKFVPCQLKKKKKRLPLVNEVSVAKYLKELHELSGDVVKLQPTIELGYRPDMMIYSPSSDFLVAVEVEPYDRRKYGIQQAVTYGKFGNAQPMLVTFGDCAPNKNEQLSLSRHRVLWLHIQTKLTGKIKESNFISNFSMMK